MDPLSYWRLSDRLTVQQAAILILGLDPSSVVDEIEDPDIQKVPNGYPAVVHAISIALLEGDIEGNVVPCVNVKIDYFEPFEDEYLIIPDSVDVHRSTVRVSSLKIWLSKRGAGGNFFCEDKADAPKYLDPSHERYSPKLAAAVQAWQAMDNETLYSRRTPKQALTKWLGEHAAEFGLADDNGKPNKTGIEEVAKVANWRPEGGAPKTP